MAFNDFRKAREEGRPAPPPTTGSGVGALTAFIDQGSEFSGKLSFKDTVRIDGKLEGQISSDNTLIVGETGEIRANIRSDVVIVSGLIEGDVMAQTQIVLHKTGRIKGNVKTARLSIEEGAQLNGRVSMGANVGSGKDQGKDKVVPMADKSKPRSNSPMQSQPIPQA